MPKTVKFDSFRQQLHAMRSRLDERITELRNEACHGAGGENAGDLSAAPIHLADAGGQETEAVVNLGLAENEATLRREVEDALRRLDDETFGICEECRSEIDPKRLQAVPYARLCIHCAKRDQ